MSTVRRRAAARLAALALLALSAACGFSSGEPTGAGDPRPQRMAVGTPIGPLATAVIGPEGGALPSLDGRLLLTVPPGAVAAPTTFSVQEITDTAPGGIGSAYRLAAEPAGLALPVEIAFDASAAEVPVTQLTLSYQAADGFWLRTQTPTREPSLVSVASTRLGDWALVSRSPRDMRGTYTLTSSLGGVAVTLSGESTLSYSGEDALQAYFLQWGTMTGPAQLSDGAATCTPLQQVQSIANNVADLQFSPAAFEWSTSAVWQLSCVEGGAQRSDLYSITFDTVGYTHLGCTRLPGAQIATTAELTGSYAIDCGAEGRVDASWTFATCTPGLPCTTANACRTAATTCDTGIPSCTETGDVTDGTACGTYRACSGGACTCTAGVSCTPETPPTSCQTAAVTCDATTGAPACTVSNLPNGTSCGTGQVCQDGACTCASGASCTPETPPTVCQTAAIACDPVTGGATCAVTNLADGTPCGQDLACQGGACVCSPGATCTPATPTTVCQTAAITCDPTSGAPVCTVTNIANGTTCGQDLACQDGACVCAPGAACVPAGGLTACQTAAVTCDPTSGAPVCTATNLANGTSCGADQACQDGACVCVAGGACTPTTPPTVCQTAAVACDPTSGAPVCATTNLPAGTSCGQDLACDGSGACVCVPGGACTPATPPTVCQAAAIACDPTSGAPVCATTNLPAGTSCGQDLACDGSGACVCVAGGACSPATPPTVCQTAAVACDPTSGAPVCATSNLPAGTSCGQDLACDGSGACVCVAGGACTPTTPPTVCQTAAVACDPTSGAPVCATSNLPDDTSCGDIGMLCRSGACACVPGGACTPDIPPSECQTGVIACDPTSGLGTCGLADVVDGTPCSVGSCVAGVCTP